jgi:hypothetical protein
MTLLERLGEGALSSRYGNPLWFAEKYPLEWAANAGTLSSSMPSWIVRIRIAPGLWMLFEAVTEGVTEGLDDVGMLFEAVTGPRAWERVSMMPGGLLSASWAACS